MNWEHLSKFIAVAEAGSFTAAAARAGGSAATFSRKVAALEASLGAVLLKRGRDGVRLTETGRQVLAEARRAAEALTSIERLGRAGRSETAAPLVRVSATEPLNSEILAPALGALRAKRPRLRLALISSTAVADLRRDEAEIALRLFRPKGDGLTARRLPDIEIGCFAAPDYLRRIGGEAADLSKAALLAFDPSYGSIAEVTWVREQGLEGRVVLRSTSARALLNAAAAGQGVAIAPRFMAAGAGLSPAPAPPIPNRQCWLVSHPDLSRDRATSAVKRWIAETVAATLAR